VKVRRLRVFVSLATAALVFASCGSSGVKSGSGQATAPGVSGTTVKIGFITSLSGPYAPGFEKAADAAKARVSVVNAAGGIDGRKLQLFVADDQSSPAGALAAAKQLVEQDGVFGVVTESGFFTAAYNYLKQAGVPVVGGSYSGPEWGDPSNTNMFADFGGYDPNYPAWTQYGIFLKQMGITKFGVVSYTGATHGGVPCVYQDFTTPPGGVNFTTQALAMKNAGVQAFYTNMVSTSAFALEDALKQAGVDVKAALVGVGYGQTLLGTPSVVQSAQGMTFPLQIAPEELGLPATKAMLAGLGQYMGWKGDVDWEVSQGWVSLGLMSFGLQKAGAQLTRAGFITNLRKVTNYTADGLNAGPVDFSSWTGTDPQSSGGCWYAVTLTGSKFAVDNGGKPYCGKPISG